MDITKGDSNDGLFLGLGFGVMGWLMDVRRVLYVIMIVGRRVPEISSC